MARKLINEESAIAQLSDNSMRWLCQALDPFPDYEQAPASWPDIEGSASIVQIVKGTFNVNAPTAAGTGLWDAHFFTLPNLRDGSTGTTALSNAFDSVGRVYTLPAASIGEWPLSWLTCTTAPTGSPTLYDGIGTSPPAFHNVNVDAYCAGPTRVVAAAFEVRNTTAAINKQGTVTVYCMPQTITTETLNFEKTGSAGTAYDITTMTSKMPPATLDDAMVLFGSRQWEASEGVYAPVTFCETDNPFTGGAYVRGAYKAFDNASHIATNHGLVYADQDPESGTFNASRKAPINTHGAYFTGLSNETTLTCTWKLYLERAPGYNLRDLAPLAFRQGSFDPDAFKLYAAIVNKLPPACKAGDNDAGDWFKGVMDKVADFAPAIAPAIAGAFGLPPSVGTAIAGVVAPGLRNFGERVAAGTKNKSNKKKKQPPKLPPGAKPAQNTFIPKGKTAAALPEKVLRPQRKVKASTREANWLAMARRG